MSSISPFVTFQPGRGQSAEAAMDFYLALLPGSRVISDQRYGADDPGPEGSVQVAELELAGQRVRFSDSFVDHAWDLTPAVSLWLELDSGEEQRRVLDALAEGGTVHMPLDDYGFGPFGWVDDRYGLSWQVAVVG
ncbi:VOC family protein [Marmoricola endophyticus]|uniref:VOC family protein n=1 Tax=Marmoricola endophyticus TaxID=2040280 RepID=A0A917BP61_9ACTN|nr:VOC family protein [Marmoricola endophyticus]GGF50881.1 VOC family protein [Marmoricola endophyticus]